MGLYPEMRWFSCQRPVLPSDWGLGTGPHLADILTHVFDDHLVGCNGLHGKQAPLVDPAAAEPELLLPELEGRRRHTVLLGASLHLTPCLGCRPPRGGACFWPRTAAPAPRTLRGAAPLPPGRPLTLSWFSFSRSLSMTAEVPMALSSRRCSDRRSESTRLVPWRSRTWVRDRRNHGKRCQRAREQGRASPECPLLPAAGPKQGTHPGTCPFPSC